MKPHADTAGAPSSSAGLLNAQSFDVVAGALHLVVARVEEVGPKHHEAARLIRLGLLNEAFPVMSACLGAWQEIQGSLTAAAAAVGQPVERLAELVLTPTGRSSTGPIAELATALHQIKQTVQTRDWIGLADALEYDLGDLAQRWHAALLQPEQSEEAAAGGLPEFSRSAPAA